MIYSDRTYVEDYEMTPEQMKENDTKYSKIRISVGYSLGGYNYFSGQKTARRYRISVTPVEVSENRGFQVITRTLLGGNWESGLAFPSVETKRYSKPALEKLANKIDFQEIGRLYAKSETQKIMTIAGELK